MKPLNSLTKRDLLAAKKFNPDDLRMHAEQFFSEERFGDAFEFYRKLGDEEGILKVKKVAIELGDPEILWRVEHDNPARVAREDWLRCGERAMSLGKWRSAAYVFRRIGEAARLAEAEKEFMPAAAAPALRSSATPALRSSVAPAGEEESAGEEEPKAPEEPRPA
jgi:hypothetical protein